MFTPVVFEAHGGGWGAAASRIYGSISKQQNSSGFRCKEGSIMRIAQRISSAIHMANSRAILKRLWPEESCGNEAIDLEAADADEDQDL